MYESARQEILHKLDEGKTALFEAIAGVDEGFACKRPAAPGTWSILDCVEHVGLVEEGLVARLMSAEASQSAVAEPARERTIATRGTDRSTRLEAPAGVRPRGRFLNLRDALEAFHAARERTVAWVMSQEGDLRSRLTTHPLISGPINCYEMLLIIAVHPARHAQQIHEIRTSEKPEAPDPVVPETRE